jgi:alpha-L-fucosidase 2
MPELAGCIAVTERLLALPAVSRNPSANSGNGSAPSSRRSRARSRRQASPGARRVLRRQAQHREPGVVSRVSVPAVRVQPSQRRLGVAALEHRWDRGHSGWRQDDIFMAYLGLTDEARQGVVSRARSYDRNERFPAFWGPNYDWTPDQDHGGVLMKAFQSMLLQTDGRKIFLCRPGRRTGTWSSSSMLRRKTIVEGVYRDGSMQSLRVTPEARRADITVVSE